jgi:hypothetical protein
MRLSTCYNDIDNLLDKQWFSGITKNEHEALVKVVGHGLNRRETWRGRLCVILLAGSRFAAPSPPIDRLEVITGRP